MKKKAIITGITGQDGSYLAEFLLKKGYEVHGIIRRSSTFSTARVDHIFKDPHTKGIRFFMHYGDISNTSNLAQLIERIRPNEIYNLGAQSHVRVSFDIPEYTADITGLGALRILEAIRTTDPKIKYYQASSSEMFGKAIELPLRETSSFHPRSPYGCAKVFAHWITKNYRESYGIFACSGILFNHESPRRGETFVTRKITRGIARIKLGLDNKLFLGNLDAKRDWGFAGDYIRAMWLMLQQDKPNDYVIATGKAYSVRDFLVETIATAGIKARSNNKKGLAEKFINTENGKVIVEIDPRYYRPAEVDILLGDASRARKELKWRPKVMFKELVKTMYKFDFENERKNR